MLQAGKSIYLYVTINDGHVTSKTQVWAKVEGPGGGRKPGGGGGGGIPSKFLPPILRPPLPLPPSIPVNGAGGGDGVPAVAFVPSNNKPPLTRTSSARPSAASRVPTARPTPAATQTAVAATTEASTPSPTAADPPASPTAAEASTSPTAADQSAASTASTAVADQSTAAATTARPNEPRNVTETAASPPTVTTQQPAQNNMILALVPIAVAAVFLTAAGVLACLFRKRLFSAKVKSKKVNSIVSYDQLRGA